jgi:hypothetical protein
MDRAVELLVEIRESIRRVLYFTVPDLFLWTETASYQQRLADFSGSDALHGALLFFFMAPLL